MIISLVIIPSLSAQQSDSISDSNNNSIGGHTDVSCGDNIDGTVTLSTDLNCINGDGLRLENGAKLFLNGHSIRGPGIHGTNVGLDAERVNNAVVQGPGIINNFKSGILTTGVNSLKLSSIILRDNEIGLFVTDSGNFEINNNTIRNNNLGIAAHSSDRLNITSNTFSDNTLSSITFVKTQMSRIGLNNINGSQNGVFTDAQSSQNTVKSNHLSNNVIDINNANGLQTNVNSNSYSDNICRVSNPSGIC
jgi:nitrous oxidase accessory protein NosD